MKHKRFVSVSGVLVLIISAVALVTGCQQANNNKDKAVYVAKVEIEGTSVTYTLIFKADGTWINRAGIGSQDIVTMEGTYTGDPSKDGTVTITVTKLLKGAGSLVDVEKPQSMDITVKGGKCSIAGMEYTRQ